MEDKRAAVRLLFCLWGVLSGAEAPFGVGWNPGVWRPMLSPVKAKASATADLLRR